MQKQVEFFLNFEDEINFSKKIINRYENLIILNGSLWVSGEIEKSDSISNCSAKTIYFWNKDIFEKLSVVKRKDGRLVGPASGEVVQMMRSFVSGEGLLLSGRLAVGYDHSQDQIRPFYDALVAILKDMSVNKLSLLSYPEGGIIKETVSDIWVGKNTLEQIKNTGEYLKSRNSEHYYKIKN